MIYEPSSVRRRSQATLASAGVAAWSGRLQLSHGALAGNAQDPRPDRRTEPLMPAPPRNDPYKAFNFLVEIDGIAHAVFSEVTGLESETAVIEYRAGGENVVRKLPGLTKFGNITLKRGITQDAELWNWRKSIVDGDIDRRNGSIVLLDDQRSPVVRWNFHNGWICKWEGPALSAKSNEVAIETMEIAHEGLELA
jgi:phage tail-like protein